MDSDTAEKALAVITETLDGFQSPPIAQNLDAAAVWRLFSIRK